MMSLTERERDYLYNIIKKMEDLRKCLNSLPLPTLSEPPAEWYRYLSRIKGIVGNLDNDISFVACLMAKECLVKSHPIGNLDVALKPQGAPGHDIDVTTDDGKRLVAEIKTTTPFAGQDLGSQQKQSFQRDFAKLKKAEADSKYFFVTEEPTFHIVKRKYRRTIPDVTVVLVPQALRNQEHILAASTSSDLPESEMTKELISHPSQSSPWGVLANKIRLFIKTKYIEPARQRGQRKLVLRSGEIHRRMGLKNRYPAVCSAMRGRKIEDLCGVSVVGIDGTVGANFVVTYDLGGEP